MGLTGLARLFRGGAWWPLTLAGPLRRSGVRVAMTPVGGAHLPGWLGPQHGTGLRQLPMLAVLAEQGCPATAQAHPVRPLAYP